MKDENAESSRSEARLRIANALKLLSVFVQMKMRGSQSAEAREKLGEIDDCIEIMCELSSRLDLAEDVALEQAMSYAVSRRAEATRSRNIDVRFQSENAPRASIEAAMQLNLILHEALTNAVDHGFPDDRAGEVEVLLTREGEDGLLVVSDSGVGLPVGWQPDEARSGTRLLTETSSSVGGHPEWSRSDDGWTSLRINFRAT